MKFDLEYVQRLENAQQALTEQRNQSEAENNMLREMNARLADESRAAKERANKAEAENNKLRDMIEGVKQLSEGRAVERDSARRELAHQKEQNKRLRQAQSEGQAKNAARIAELQKQLASKTGCYKIHDEEVHVSSSRYAKFGTPMVYTDPWGALTDLVVFGSSVFYRPNPPLGLNWDYLKSPEPEYPLRWRNAAPFDSRW